VKQLLKKKIVWDFKKENQLLFFENTHTVCEESRCPNRKECSDNYTVTFLIGGDKCTRNCGFCHVKTGKPLPIKEINEKETDIIIKAAQKLNSKYVVLTSVTRDDDEEGLALYFADLTRKLKEEGFLVEVLIPDFHGDMKYLNIILESRPNVIAHNIETIESLSKKIRPQASYNTSLQTLSYLKNNEYNLVIKSGFMIGLGENMNQIKQVLRNLSDTKIDILTVGQYLQPSKNQLEVKKYYTDEDFFYIKNSAEMMSFKTVYCGYFVRSSYNAFNAYKNTINYKKN